MMEFPDFFATAPTVTMRDPLAAFLGAAKDGVMTYTYGDAVKLAGHSCPTVAGAWLMLCTGLRHLYGDDVPERGNIAIWLREPRDEGVAGVIASVATLLTGAAAETGFGGIGPQSWFSRRNLLHFGASINGTLAMRRNDTGLGAVLDLDTGAVPPAGEMRALFPAILGGHADDDTRARFATLWQDRVERMLVEHATDSRLVQLRDWTPADTDGDVVERW